MRVLLAGSGTLFRQGLRTLLKAQPDIQVLGEAVDSWEAVAAIDFTYTASSSVDVDVTMGSLSGSTAQPIRISLRTCGGSGGLDWFGRYMSR